MNRESHMSGKGGFTLIETVVVVAITAVVGLFLTGFLSSQLKIYLRFDETLSAKMVCSSAYSRIEKELRYAYVYYEDPGDPGSLRYYVRPEMPLELRDRLGNLKLPSVSGWPSLCSEDMEDIGRDDMRLELDFTGTSPYEAHIRMTVTAPAGADGDEPGRVIYIQDVVIPSLYSGESREEGINEEN